MKISAFLVGILVVTYYTGYAYAAYLGNKTVTFFHDCESSYQEKVVHESYRKASPAPEISPDCKAYIRSLGYDV